MESKYYTAKDVSVMTGYAQSKAYEIISKMNCEIQEMYKDEPEENKPLILQGRVLKSYFDKKMEV